MGRPGRISRPDAAPASGQGGSPAVTSPPCPEDGETLARLVYVSRAAPCLGTAEVYAIIRRAHAGNGAAGVTGALVFLDGWFAQVLEGPAAVLEARLAQISRDPRHGALQVRQRERVHARVFAGQPMALRTRACLDAGVLDAVGYRPGFPVAEFPADVLVEFIAQACRRMRPA